MTESLWAVAPLLQARFQQQLRRGMRGFAQVCFNQLMKVEQLLVLGCSPYERVPQRRGYRNGYQRRFLESRWGTLRLAVPRTRNTPAPFRSALLERYRRRQRELEELICDLVAGGLSHRRVARLARESLGVPLSAQSVSAILSALDAEVACFHRRSLEGRYRTVYLDGKHAKSRFPASASRRRRGRMRPRVLLLAWGVTHQGTEELIDYRVVPSESQEHWQAFLSDLAGC